MGNVVKRKKGLALITTLMVMSLLLTLISAFIQVERANNRLTGNALERRAAQDACLTALNYAWNRLENNPAWGTAADFPLMTPTFYPATRPTARLETRLGPTGQRMLHGVIQAEGNFSDPTAVSFDLTIFNNLSNRKDDNHGAFSVPARSCRLACVAQSGRAQRKMETILRQVPISYDALVSRGRADLGGLTGLLRLESRDPYVNRMRAGGDLLLPPANEVQFLKNGSAEATNLFLNGTSQTTDSQLAAAGAASGGNYRVGQGPPTIPSFDPENFKLPDDPTKETQVAAGTYRFGGIPHVEYEPHNIAWEQTTTDPITNQTTTIGGSVTRYQKLTSTYDQLIDAQGRIWLAKDAREGSVVRDPAVDPPDLTNSPSNYGYGAPGPSGIYDANGSQIPPSSTDTHEIYPGLWVNVVTAQMAILPGYKVECPGAFTVTAEGDRPPEMLFGYRFTAGGVAEQESLDDGLDAALDHPERYMAALVASGGIDIPGGAIGFGSMISSGDMTVKASSGLRAAPQLGVVVKARNLTINPATEPEPQLPGEPVSMDYPIFKDAINTFVGGDWTQFDTWLTQTSAQRRTITRNFKTTGLSASPTTYWNQLNTELQTNFPVPDWTAVGWSGSTTMEQYVRMKEYLQTLAARYNHGLGDPSWLNMNAHVGDAEARLSNMVGSMAQWAKSYKKSLQDYLASPTPQVPEMFYQGLLYADQDLTINAPNKSFRLEGSAVAGRNIVVQGANLDLVYDRELVDGQLKTNHTVGGHRDHMRLEKIFFVIQ